MAVNVQRAGASRRSGAKLVKRSKSNAPTDWRQFFPNLGSYAVNALNMRADATRYVTAWANATGRPAADLMLAVRDVLATHKSTTPAQLINTLRMLAERAVLGVG